MGQQMVREITPRNGWTSLVDDDVAFRIADEGKELSGSARDFSFLRGFHHRCQCLALANYASVPMLYVLAHAGYIYIGYGAIVGQVVAGLYQQVKLLLLLRRWCQHLPHLL